MKAFCISDNTDTLVGLRLAGIESVVVHEREEVILRLLIFVRKLFQNIN